MPTVVVDTDTRGRGTGLCLYCGQPVGRPHTDSCVVPKTKVKVRATIEYEIDMPSAWDTEMILFHLNEGTRCKDHIIEELERITDPVDEEDPRTCLCWIAEYQLVDDNPTTKKDTNDS